MSDTGSDDYSQDDSYSSDASQTNPLKRDATRMGPEVQPPPKRRKEDKPVHLHHYVNLLNQEIEDARDGIRYDYDSEGDDGIQGGQIAASFWSREEKLRFFNALAIYGRDNVAQLASVVGRSPTEIRAYLIVLEDASLEYKLLVGEHKSSIKMRNIPAAVELSEKLVEKLDILAKELDVALEDAGDVAEEAKYGEDAVMDWRIGRALEIEYMQQELSDLKAEFIAELELEDQNGPRPEDDTDSPSESSADDEPESPPMMSGALLVDQPMQEFAKEASVSSDDIPIMEQRRRAQEKKEEQTRLEAHQAHLDDLNESIELLSKNLKPIRRLKPDILNRLPCAELLHVPNFLSMMHWVFMNNEEVASFHNTSDPAIRYSALEDFQNIVVSLVKRLMSVIIFQATARLRSLPPVIASMKKKPRERKIETNDVLVALKLVGMKTPDPIAFWKRVPGQYGLECYIEYKDHVGPKGSSLRYNKAISKDGLMRLSLIQAEAALSKPLYRPHHTTAVKSAMRAKEKRWQRELRKKFNLDNPVTTNDKGKQVIRNAGQEHTEEDQDMDEDYPEDDLTRDEMVALERTYYPANRLATDPETSNEQRLAIIDDLRAHATEEDSLEQLDGMAARGEDEKLWKLVDKALPDKTHASADSLVNQQGREEREPEKSADAYLQEHIARTAAAPETANEADEEAMFMSIDGASDEDDEAEDSEGYLTEESDDEDSMLPFLDPDQQPNWREMTPFKADWEAKHERMRRSVKRAGKKSKRRLRR